MGTWHDTGGGGGDAGAKRAAFTRGFKGLLKRLEERGRGKEVGRSCAKRLAGRIPLFGGDSDNCK